MARGDDLTREPDLARLRPLGAAELLDASVAIYRRCFGQLGRVMLLVAGGYALYAAASGGGAGGLVSYSPRAALRALELALLGFPIDLALRPLGMHMLATALVAQAALDAAPRAALGAAAEGLGGAGRRHPLPVALLTALLLPLSLLAGWLQDAVERGVAVALLPGADAATALAHAGELLRERGPLLLAGLAGLLAVSRLLLALPAASAEGLGVRRALARSWALTGGAYWPGAGALLAACALQAVLASLPAGLLDMAERALGGPPHPALSGAAALASAAMALLAFPVQPIALTLLYLGERARREGLREELALAAESGRRAGELRESIDAHLLAGRPAEALAAAEALLRERPDDPAGLSARMRGRLESGQPEAALADAERMLALAPRHPYAFASRAVARAALGDSLGAADDARRALELQPSLAAEVEHAASLHAAGGHLRPALAYLDILVLLRSGSAEAHYARARALAGLARADEALWSLGAALDLDPALRERARADEALSALRADDRLLSLLSAP